MYKYITNPESYRLQLIGADRRSIDRALFNKFNAPKSIGITKKKKAVGPSIRFTFNTTGWPKRHQDFYFKELRVDSIDECKAVYMECLEEMKAVMKLNHQTYLALKSSWKEFISCYDHYFN